MDTPKGGGGPSFTSPSANMVPVSKMTPSPILSWFYTIFVHIANPHRLPYICVTRQHTAGPQNNAFFTFAHYEKYFADIRILLVTRRPRDRVVLYGATFILQISSVGKPISLRFWNIHLLLSNYMQKVLSVGIFIQKNQSASVRLFDWKDASFYLH